MPTAARSTRFAGLWFDGLSSRAQPVHVLLEPTPQGPRLTLHRSTADHPLPPPTAPLDAAAPAVLELAHPQVGWPASHSADPVLLDLHEHGSLEIATSASLWAAAYAQAGGRSSLAQRMQTRWRVLWAVAAMAAIALALFYRYGTPWLATQITRAVPLQWEVQIAERVLRELDEGPLVPSRLPPERQQQLQAQLAALAAQAPAQLQRYPGYTPNLSLAFRRGLGANALALPGGQLVMTDGMVRTAERLGLDDAALVGVLAHEMGHVMHRHSTRMVVEQGVLQIGLGLALGDVSALLSSGAAVLTGLAYNRSHEREADCYALAVLRSAGLPTAPMAELLLAIERDIEGDSTQAPRQPSGGTPAPESESASAEERAQRGHPLWSLLSSHPDTVPRARALREGQAEGCERP